MRVRRSGGCAVTHCGVLRQRLPVAEGTPSESISGEQRPPLPPSAAEAHAQLTGTLSCPQLSFTAPLYQGVLRVSPPVGLVLRPPLPAR